MIISVLKFMDEDFRWPEMMDILISQKDVTLFAKERGKVTAENKLLHNSNCRVWIPKNDVKLQLRICIIEPCRRARNYGLDSTKLATKKFCFWKHMVVDVESLYNSCINCASTISGTKLPHPLAHMLHATNPNEILHFDVLNMGPSMDGTEYVLLMKDYASYFCWLLPCFGADGPNATRGILQWFSTFFVVPTWCSDQEVISKLNHGHSKQNARLYK